MIKNLIFDFGGVIIPISESKTWKAFEALGANSELRSQNEIFNNYETGKISSTEFQKALQPFFFRKVFPNDIGTAWNELIDTVLPEDNVQFLKMIKSKYRIFLLSNTNELHINKIKDEAGPFLYNQFLAQFEKVYYSYEIGMRKPNKEIFEHVLNENDLKVEETFYIEDSKHHIIAADELGIRNWDFDPEVHDLTDLDKVLSKLH